MTSSRDAYQAEELSRGRFEPDPHRRQPLKRIRTAHAVVRMLLDRSAESASRDEPSQDYLVVEHRPGRICFAVADGVGSSFLGHLAAAMLAGAVTTWMFDRPPPNSENELRDELTEFLEQLADEAAPIIATYPIPDHPAEVVRDVLAEKRRYGSEAMLACGRIDWPETRPAQVALAWLGDAQLLVLSEDGRELNLTGRTSDRWSTKVGPRGLVQTRVLKAAQAERVLVCSDGVLGGLSAAVELPDTELELLLAGLAARKNSDDMALIDIALDASAMPPVVGPAGESPDGDQLKDQNDQSEPAEQVEVDENGNADEGSGQDEGDKEQSAEDEGAGGPEPPVWRFAGDELSWTEVGDANGYHLQIAEDPEFRDPIDYHLLITTKFDLPQLPAGMRWVRMRTITDGCTGTWGEGEQIDSRPTEHTTASKPRRTSSFIGRHRGSSSREPQNLSAHFDQSMSRVHLRWSAVPGARAYRLRLIDSWGELMIVKVIRNEAWIELHRDRYVVLLRSEGKGWQSDWTFGEVRVGRG